MKKLSLYPIIIILIIVSVFTLTANAEFNHAVSTENIEKDISVTIAINDENIIYNGIKDKITPPILVFNRTYVDLYSIALFLNYRVTPPYEYTGAFRVEANGNSLDFYRISQHNDLITKQNMFFAKDNKIFVSLRELTDMLGYPIEYDNGLIHIGVKNPSDNEAFGIIDVTNEDDYICREYPPKPEYVVYPYQEYSYDTMMKDARKLQEMYPNLIKLSSIGNSVEGRELLLMEFGRGKTKIFVCGTHHAREYIATTYLMYAIDRYAYSYYTNTMWGGFSTKEILDKVTFCIVPMVNPDGVNLVQNGIYATTKANELSNMGIYESPKYGYSAWKANINGVDVNWNYDKDWEISKNKNPRGSTGFNGFAPNTEPETIAVSDYVDSHIFDMYLSFHTQGQIFYWADEKGNPSNVQKAIEADTGFIGFEEECTGRGGSFFDYVYRKYNKPTVTVELCPYVGNYPYPNKDFDTIWRPAKNILLVSANEILYRNSLR